MRQLILYKIISNNIIDTIKIVDPISIDIISDNGFNYSFWVPTIIAIISTLFLIWDKIKTSKVYGKIISRTHSQYSTFNYTDRKGLKHSINGQQYILKLSLSCYRKSLNFKDVNVILKYNNVKTNALIYFSEVNNLTFHNQEGLDKEKMLTPADDFLTFHNVLEKGKTSFYYLNFIVPNKSGPELFDKMILEFIKPNNRKLKVEIFEIDDKQFYFDKSLLLRQ